MAVKDYHRMSNAERTKMLFFMKDRILQFNGKTREEVAKICMEGLGSHVNSQHIKTGREYLENAGVELWEESKNKFRKSRREEREENEKLMADVKLLTKKIDIILEYLPLNAKEKLQINGRDPDEEYKSFLNTTPSMEDWVDNLNKEN